MKKHKKVLILWSWALKIWQAWEFDYSWSQAIKALKEEWIKSVLINPNIATVQTDEWFADVVYFLPVTPHFVEKIIKKEKPDGIFLWFGWQTALNCWLELKHSWILEKYNIDVLWTPVEIIDLTEDRKKFNAFLKKIDVKFPKSIACNDVESSLKAAEKIEYPVMVRAAFTLWWQWSGFANNKRELKSILKKSFSYSSQVIIEENLRWWKELEYEVIRDWNDNCITVCNMENFDPMWIHTWESIVIAPSQTLSNKDYHLLRSIAIKTIKNLWIVWECNIQYAYDPHSYEYRVIEVNARLSRSSALASKATWYPLAYVAAKIWIWYSLIDIQNSITGVTKSMFEPSLDYVVMKYPRWDLQKFDNVDQELWSEMKSVWEVMSIWKTVEEVFQKAIRNLEIWANWLTVNPDFDIDYSMEDFIKPSPKRIFAISDALSNGISVNEIYNLTKIDKFFLYKIKNVIDISKEIKNNKNISPELLKKAKIKWFSDKQIAILTKKDELEIREIRKKYDIIPVIKQIDTLAAEFPAQTNYLYSTYSWTDNDIPKEKKSKNKKIIVLGSGSYRIGSSVEFDRCSVNCIKTLKSLWYETIILNYNPETVSTDFDTSDKLYFDEITLEKILDIYDFEKPYGIILSMWWQVANNLALPLQKAWVKILWTNPKDIDRAEDRNKFSSLLDKIWVWQPEWSELTTIKWALKFADKVWFPVLIRPSYVLSWANMRVCLNDDQLISFLTTVADISKEHPAVISKFETWAKEIEIDGVWKSWKLVIYAISEHVENAWVHSGDATVVLPPQKIYLETIRKIKSIMKQIIKELNISWPFNIQFLAKDNKIKVIECNLRSSRSFPFVSKVTKHNFISIATKSILWLKDVESRYNTLDLDYVGVKAPQFSFNRLKWADPKLWVEMASTWEVWCFGKDIHQAFLTAILSVWIKLPKKNILISIWEDEDRVEFLKSMEILEELWFKLFTIEWTHDFYKKHKINTKVVNKIHDNKNENVITLMEDKKIDFVINWPNFHDTKVEISDWFKLRRKAIDLAIPLINNIKIARLFVESIHLLDGVNLMEVRSYGEY